MDPQAIVANLGVLGAFAMVVWYELREQRKERREDAAATREILAELRQEMAALLEYMRIAGAGPVDPYGRPLSREDAEVTPTRRHRALSRPRGVEVVRVPPRASSSHDDEE